MGRLRPALAPLLTVGAAGLIWLMWREVGILQGTLLWDLRFLVFGVAVIALLTLAEWIVGKTHGHADDP